MRIFIIVLMCVMCGVACAWEKMDEESVKSNDPLVYDGSLTLDPKLFEDNNPNLTFLAEEEPWGEMCDAPDGEQYHYRTIKLSKKYIQSVSVVDNGEQITITLHWK